MRVEKVKWTKMKLHKSFGFLLIGLGVCIAMISAEKVEADEALDPLDVKVTYASGSSPNVHIMKHYRKRVWILEVDGTKCIMYSDPQGNTMSCDWVSENSNQKDNSN